MEDNKLNKTIKDCVKNLGYHFVIAKFRTDDDKSLLQVMIENKDGSCVTISDCEKVSKNLSMILDVEDLIATEYRLEISSTGMARPLTEIEDYDRFTGFLAKIEVFNPSAGTRKRFKGKIIGRKENIISLELPEGKTEIGFNNIKQAKLIVSDEMIEEALRKGKTKWKKF